MLTLGVGIVGRNQRRGHNQRRVGPSCVRLVYFLPKSIKFHDMRTECQIIIFHFLLLVSHKLPSIDKCCLLPYLLPIFAPRSLFLSLLIWSTIIVSDDLNKEDRGEMMQVVVNTENRGDMIQVVVNKQDRGDIMTEQRGHMIMMVVVPTQVLTSITK